MSETLMKLTNETGEWVSRPLNAAELAQREIDAAAYEVDFGSVRSDRNGLLAATDWTQLPDAPVDAAAWATYRQQLRDLPANFTRVSEVIWPDPPA